MNERTVMKRVGWIDAVRYIAIFHVVFIHTLDMFWPQLLNYWVTPPSSYLPFLLNAKVAVLLFCVLLGFFAAKPQEFKLRSFVKYALKRYVQFAFFLLLSGILYAFGAYFATWVFHSPDEFAFRVICDGFQYNLIYILRDALLFEANYNPTMWSMQQFFIASILCYLLGCAAYKRKPLSVASVTAGIVLLLLLTGSEYLSWVAFCVMGVFVRLFVENIDRFDFMNNRSMRIVLFLLAWFLFKFPMPECTLVFFLMSLGSVLLLAVCFSSPAVHRLFDRPPLPALGKLAFGVYVVHTPINSLLCSSFQPIFSRMLPVPVVTALCFVFTICTATLCAFVLDRLYTAFSARLFREKVRI